MNGRVPAPLAKIQIPDWGSTWPVVEIDGDRWVVECFGRRRELATSQVNLLHFFPTRNGISATKGERYTEAEPVAEDVKGEAYREWAGRRMKQIQ